jgi:adenylyltransferase/sulfurtransferase
VDFDRYHRQTLLPQLGRDGQARLADARVLLVGCGALGGTIAEQLVRAGVGFVRLVDRDIVELTNLQRQVLFDEEDARTGVPKAVAAGARLRRINSTVTIDSVVADVRAENVEALAGITGAGPRVDLILDGTDNVETRYLLNDVAVKHKIAWVYGACVSFDGRVLPVLPGVTPCLRCLFLSPPGPGELPTCDTAGVMGPVATVVAALQAVEGIKLLLGKEPERMLLYDGWKARFHSMNVAESRLSDCACCARGQFEFLDARPAGGTTSLCGRDAVQVTPAAMATLDLRRVASKLGAAAGDMEATPFLLRCRLAEPAGLHLTLFADGRLIVKGTTDPQVARSVYARYVGN